MLIGIALATQVTRTLQVPHIIGDSYTDASPIGVGDDGVTTFSIMASFNGLDGYFSGAPICTSISAHLLTVD
jgi:hypothetical protein